MEASDNDYIDTLPLLYLPPLLKIFKKLLLGKKRLTGSLSSAEPSSTSDCSLPPSVLPFFLFTSNLQTQRHPCSHLLSHYPPSYHPLPCHSHLHPPSLHHFSHPDIDEARDENACFCPKPCSKWCSVSPEADDQARQQLCQHCR